MEEWFSCLIHGQRPGLTKVRISGILFFVPQTGFFVHSIKLMGGRMLGGESDFANRLFRCPCHQKTKCHLVFSEVNCEYFDGLPIVPGHMTPEGIACPGSGRMMTPEDCRTSSITLSEAEGVVLFLKQTFRYPHPFRDAARRMAHSAIRLYSSACYIARSKT